MYGCTVALHCFAFASHRPWWDIWGTYSIVAQGSISLRIPSGGHGHCPVSVFLATRTRLYLICTVLVLAHAHVRACEPAELQYESEVIHLWLKSAHVGSSHRPTGGRGSRFERSAALLRAADQETPFYLAREGRDRRLDKNNCVLEGRSASCRRDCWGRGSQLRRFPGRA